jgi:hypothetical protein
MHTLIEKTLTAPTQKAGFRFPKYSFVVYQKLVFQIMYSDESPTLRVAANR